MVQGILMFAGLTCLASMINNQKATSNSDQVYDVIHNNVPNLKSTGLTDLLTVLPIGYFLLTSNLNVVSDYLLQWSIIFILRMITVRTTILPRLPEGNDCKKRHPAFGACTDYIYSGHLSSLLLASLFLVERNIHTLPLLGVYNIITAFLIVAQRKHYTVDAVLAWVITTLVHISFRPCP